MAEERARAESESLIRGLEIEDDTPLAEIGERLLGRSVRLPAPFVSEMAELLIGELSCSPTERGLLFLAPGADKAEFLGPLASLNAEERGTEIFVAMEGDTLPSATAVHALPLPEDVSPEITWIVRFGEAPPYALVAGPRDPAGERNVFHTAERALVEHLAFRLRSEVGVGLRT